MKFDSNLLDHYLYIELAINYRGDYTKYTRVTKRLKDYWVIQLVLLTITQY